MKPGDRVIVVYPDELEDDVGTIIEGPVFQNGRAAFKVRNAEADNWVPADWLKRSIRAVKE